MVQNNCLQNSLHLFPSAPSVNRETADEISPHWRGSNYVLYEKKAEQHVVLAYASEWDDAAAAREFFRYYRQVLQGKWKQMQIAAESDEEAIAELRSSHVFMTRELWDRHRLVALIPPGEKDSPSKTDVVVRTN